MKKLSLILVLTAVFSVITIDAIACSGCGCQVKKTEQKVNYIDKAEMQKMIKDQKNLVIIDVLSPASYAKSHVKGAISIPLDKLHDDSVLKTLDKDKTYIVYCANKKCQASTKGAKILLEHGYKNVYDNKNGIAEWKEENLPTETSKP